jgi:hypothetical protein
MTKIIKLDTFRKYTLSPSNLHGSAPSQATGLGNTYQTHMVYGYGWRQT